MTGTSLSKWGDKGSVLSAPVPDTLPRGLQQREDRGCLCGLLFKGAALSHGGKSLQIKIFGAFQ